MGNEGFDWVRLLIVLLLGVIMVGVLILEYFIARDKTKKQALMIPFVFTALGLVAPFLLTNTFYEIDKFLFNLLMFMIPAILLYVVYFSFRGNENNKDNKEDKKIDINNL
ncbi:MAG: hypothetical protein RBQ97_02090 [Acholeplasma sp.]|nr:hypothetical protein [Acholeplasma sp.]